MTLSRGICTDNHSRNIRVRSGDSWNSGQARRPGMAYQRKYLRKSSDAVTHEGWPKSATMEPVSPE